MTGPEHFAEGEAYLRASEQARLVGDPAAAQHQATMAQAHFLAALVAIHATAEPHRSVSWQEVLGR